MSAVRRLLAIALLLIALPAAADPRCIAEPGTWGPFPPLPPVTQALAEGRLTIVALGSSSTSGTGASAPERTYPARLERLLAARLPTVRVRVINAGAGGETIADNLARLADDVLAHRPDLVIWQAGTNDARRGLEPGPVGADLAAGLDAIRAIGAAVVVMDAQVIPRQPEDGARRAVRLAVHEAARRAGVPVLTRHDLMAGWLAAGRFTPTTLLAPDGLHMNDASYACLAERIADLISTGVR